MKKIEIEVSEYIDMLKEITSLKKQLEDKEKLFPTAKTVNGMLREKPYENVWNTDSDVAIFAPRVNGCSGEAHKAFVRLAKLLHRCNEKFYMSETYKGSGIPHIRDIGNTKIPTFNEMSYEQHLLSAEMLNEMIPIWNKYFAKVHETVWYDAKGNGDFQKVNVLYEED